MDYSSRVNTKTAAIALGVIRTPAVHSLATHAQSVPSDVSGSSITRRLPPVPKQCERTSSLQAHCRSLTLTAPCTATTTAAASTSTSSAQRRTRQCTVCLRTLSLNAAGVIHQHGPCGAPCIGSGRTPPVLSVARRSDPVTTLQAFIQLRLRKVSWRAMTTSCNLN